MVSSFSYAIPHIIRWEGGYINHPADPGGETNYGITKKRYPDLDIKNLTQNEAKEIYKRDFWNKGQAYKINSPDTATHYLDLIVNHGRFGGARIVQRALNNIGLKTSIDGVIGPNTLALINKANQKRLNTEMGKVRIKFYDSLIQKKPEMKVFDKGWKKRANYYIEKFGGSVGMLGTAMIASLAIAGVIAIKILNQKK